MDDVIHPCELNLTALMSGGRKNICKRSVFVLIFLSDLKEPSSLRLMACVCAAVYVCVAGVQ